MTTYEPMAGSIVHSEFFTEDPEATGAFPDVVFDWEIEPVEGMDYVLWRAATPPVGGLLDAREVPFMSPSTLLSVQVDDLATARDEIEVTGAEVRRAPFDVEGHGTMAVFDAGWDRCRDMGGGDDGRRGY